MDDASIPTDVLLDHSAFLRDLARALVGESASDDLVQETWLAATRQRWSDIVRPRAWLAGVLRNKAAERHRRDQRRERREARAATPEALATAAQIAEREDLARRLLAAVFSLDEPYRTTILHRYYEGLPPRDIARATGVPVETVKSRLKRATALLRSRLEGEFEHDGREWRGSLLILAGPALPRSSYSLAASGVFVAALVLVGAGLFLAPEWFGGGAGNVDGVGLHAIGDLEPEAESGIGVGAGHSPANTDRSGPVPGAHGAGGLAGTGTSGTPVAQGGQDTDTIHDAADEVTLSGTLVLIETTSDGGERRTPVRSARFDLVETRNTGTSIAGTGACREVEVIDGEWSVSVPVSWQSVCVETPRMHGRFVDASRMDEHWNLPVDGPLELEIQTREPFVISVVGADTGEELVTVDVLDLEQWPGVASEDRVDPRFYLVRGERSPVSLAPDLEGPILVGAPGHAWQSVRPRQAGAQRQRVVLERACSLRLALRGHPATEATRVRGFRLDAAGRRQGRPALDAPAEVQSLLEGLPPGPMEIRAVIGPTWDATVLASGRVELDPDRPRELVLTLDAPPEAVPAVPLAGTLYLPEGWAGRARFVQLESVDQASRRPLLLAIGSMRTDAEELRLFHWSTEVPPGSYVLTVGDSLAREAVKVPPAGTTDVHIEVGAPVHVHVTVMDSTTGEETQDADVCWGLLSEGKAMAVGYTHYAVGAAPGGGYGFQAPPGRIEVAAELGDREGETVVELKPGRNEVVVRIQEDCRIDLRAHVDDEAVPISFSSYPIGVERLDGDGERCGHGLNARGHFLLVSVPGRYRLTFHQVPVPGYRPIPPQEVEVRRGRNVLDIALER